MEWIYFLDAVDDTLGCVDLYLAAAEREKIESDVDSLETANHRSAAGNGLD